MTDSGEKKQLHPIRTLRLEADEYHSPELTRTNRFRPNFTEDSGKLSGFDHQPIAKANTLNTILGRAKYAKRESFIHGIQNHNTDSLSRSQKSISNKSSITNNEIKNENYSPKKSVFGEYTKVHDPFNDDYQRDYLQRESTSPVNNKGLNHYFFDDANPEEQNFFQRNTTDSMQILPKINRQSFFADRSKNKRSSIDFINGVYPHLDEEHKFLQNLSNKTPKQKTSATKKKRIKKKGSRSKKKGTTTTKANKDKELEKISEGSEEKHHSQGNKKR